MDELLKEIDHFRDLTDTFTLLDVAIVFLLSFGLTLVLGWVYRATHRGVSYSQTFAHTLVILGTTVAFIMLIIGSNIARAFTLVGALSIIRFRNAIKETRDLGFVFMTMAIGMACGTRFYLLAIFATLCLSVAVFTMTRLDLFKKIIRERILILRMPAHLDLENNFGEYFREALAEYHVVSVEGVSDASLKEIVMSIVLHAKTQPDVFLAKVRELNENQKVSLILGQQEVDL